MLEFLFACLLSFIPAIFFAGIIYWMDRFEKEPKRLLIGVFLWGAVIAIIGALVSQIILSAGTLALTRSNALTDFLSGSVYAPITEELLKGLAVLLVFLLFRSHFDSILDGIIYAGITALGFAAVENFFYLLDAGDEGGVSAVFILFFLRVVLGGWNHAMFTAFTGIGLALARLSKNIAVKIIAPLAGLGLAIITHSLHNTLVSIRGGICLAFVLDWLGWIFIFGLMIWAIRREQKWLAKQLRDEIALGTLSEQQYRTAISGMGRTSAWLSALGSGRVAATRKFYRLLAQLAIKKEQREQFGDESGNAATIARVRAELARLSPGLGAG